MSEKTLDVWLAMLEVVPEPAKAAAMNLVLGALMAARSKEKTLLAATLEVTAGAAITLVFGHAAIKFGMSDGWVYAISGAVAVFGVDQSKALIARISDALLQLRLGEKKPDGDQAQV